MSNWITAKEFHQAAELLDDLEQFMTTEVAVQIPADAQAKLVRILQDSGAIRVFSMNTGHDVGVFFAIALR